MYPIAKYHMSVYVGAYVEKVISAIERSSWMNSTLLIPIQRKYDVVSRRLRPIQSIPIHSIPINASDIEKHDERNSLYPP